MGKCVHNLPVQTRSGIVTLAALVLPCFLQTRRAAGLLVVELLASGEADDELNAAAVAPWLIIAMDCILVDYGSTRYTFFQYSAWLAFLRFVLSKWKLKLLSIQK